MMKQGKVNFYMGPRIKSNFALFGLKALFFCSLIFILMLYCLLYFSIFQFLEFVAISNVEKIKNGLQAYIY